MTSWKLFVFIISLVVPSLTAAHEQTIEPIATIADGKLRGVTGTNLDGGQFYQFFGIPYAKPPVKELRFKLAQPIDPWSGVREANKSGDACLSMDSFTPSIVGSEDCLYLNVYTKQLPRCHSTPRPVMVFIYGGLLSFGSSDPGVYGPEFLMLEDIVLVTFNYRLGALGFLSFSDPTLGVPGNLGLKDQVLALKWVRNNIKNFNGDPNNVTIFGNSAGASSVHAHILSSASKGLFHKAILQSGCALNSWFWGSKDNARELVSTAGKNVSSDQEALEVLKNMTALEIFNATQKIYDSPYPADRRPFAAVIEYPNEAAFISKNPVEIIKDYAYNQVPIIMGYVETEGMIFELYPDVAEKIGTPSFDLKKIIPFNLNVSNPNDTEAILATLKELYANNSFEQRYDPITDGYILVPVVEALRLHLKTLTKPIYFYRVSLSAELNQLKSRLNRTKEPGVGHTDELGYMFHTVITTPIKPGSIGDRSVRRFVKLWTNFATYGNPTPEPKQLNVSWTPVHDPEDIQVLDIGQELEMKPIPERNRLNVWWGILKNWPLVDDESLAGGSNSPLISSNNHCPSSPRPKMTVNSQSGPPKSPRPPDDLIATAASALRRLHFKTGRNATKTSSKPQQVKEQTPPVPKVIVMGSSTASETTINTSTDSSNTIVTTVTATDGELTEGSLDTAEQIDFFSSENVTEQGRCNAVLQPMPATPKTPATARQETPLTCRHATKFTFDDLESSKGENTPKAVALIHGNQFRFEQEAAIPMETEPFLPPEEKTVQRFTDEQIEQFKVEARRRNSYKQAAQNSEQLDIESDSKLYNRTKRNSDVGGVMSDSKLHSQRQREHRRSFRRKLDVKDEKPERTSPKRRAERGLNSSPENETESPRPKQRHKKTGRRHPTTGNNNNSKSRASEKFVYDEKHLANYRPNAGTSHARVTPPLPDLRVDFFSESSDRRRSSILDTLTTPAVAAALEKHRASVCLNKCLREVGAQLDATNPSATSPINVTTNPLENPVYFGRKAPQATIVVQQASLSLDHANVTSTILLKNGNDFVGNVHATTQEANAQKLAALKSQKEENMKQLLDVANNLTLEEIHDFEMRYGSPHHNRSQSVKTPGRSSGRPNYLCLPQQRSRVASMPNTGVEEEYYRLRHFSITGKGVVNRGDSLKSRRSRSNNSVASSNSSTEQLPGPTSAAGSARTSASCSLASSRESSTSAPGPAPFRVLMLGGPAVGKSSLVSQFMTSEYLHAYDTSIDDESGEKSVSVLLAGEESELTFIDFATMDLSPDSLIKKYNDPHAYAVVYSCADRASFDCAEKILQDLWTLDTVGTKAVILVSNKADLVRSRAVTTEEGKSMATAYDCKYIETSVGINHNVDELLVGILSQIRLKLENPERSRDLFRKRSSSKKNLHRNRSPASGAATPTSGSAQNSPKKYRGSRTSASLKVRSLLGKVWARDSKSKSCENLHVL